MTAATSPITTGACYLANMEVLWEHDPDLARRIDQVDDLDMITVEPARRAGLTCRVVGSSGEPIYLHSRYDPVKEAKKWADTALEAGKKHEDIVNGRFPMCFVVDGFGLGHHLRALYDQLSGDAFMVVAERDMALLRAALEHHDFSDMFKDNRLILVTRGDRDEIFKTLQPKGTLMMMGTVFTNPLQRRDGEFCAGVHQLIGELASYLRSHMVSLLGNSVFTCENVLKNLPAYVSTAPMNPLKGRFAGKPAVLVAAGPSLRQNLPRLKEIRDRVVLISVQTTLKPLLKYGIVPDYVTTLDYHPASKRFFEGLSKEDLSGIELIAEPKANWELLDYCMERTTMRLLGNEFAKLVLRELDDHHDDLPAGATVAHLSFYLAEYLGADPIIFIGQDLGFSNNVYYSPGTALHGIWQCEYNRFCTVEMKEWERILRHRNMLRQVPDIHGQPIFTDEQMFTYLQQFEKDFARSQATVIDASGQGVKKQACEIMDFSQAVETYCQEPIDRELFNVARSEKRYHLDWLEKAASCVRSRLEEADGMLDIMTETITLAQEMLELIDEQDALNQKMIRLDELRAMVKQREKIYRLIMYVAQDAEFYRFRQDRSLGVGKIEGKERQRRQLLRDVAYVSQLKKGCERLKKLLEDCLERIEELRENGE